MAPVSPASLEKAYQTARRRRQPWEPLWRECFAFASPVRGGGLSPEFGPANRLSDRLFDSTAPDAVEQLAASLLAQLTPPWSRWFELVPGTEIGTDDRAQLAPALEQATQTLRGHFERSNFAVEIHQCYLDLVTIGTATLLFQEAAPGDASAFTFTAVPAAEMLVLADGEGRITRQFRTTSTALAGLRCRFPDVPLPPALEERLKEDPDSRVVLVEAIQPDGAHFHYAAFVPGEELRGGGPLLLAEGVFERSPFITFRWLKAAGEVYGRSPVMTALPDIKTANKVVELILKNASIAVTGIWLAEDDGVLNPANIDLAPGSIIPKAVGSAGLTPLQAPGRFDVSELVLGDLRARIRHTLLGDRLGPVQNQRMTATEVLERSAEMARLLGATFGRLQSELLLPLLQRATAILRRRGELPELPMDGRIADIAVRSPIARLQAREDVGNIVNWLETVQKLGPEAAAVVDLPATVRWLAATLGVPAELVRDLPDPLSALAAELVQGDGNAA